MPNKTPTEVKEMILRALESKGGWRYLAKQADANPVAFLGLLGKIMPLQVNGAGNVLLIEQLCVVANREWQEERRKLTNGSGMIDVTPALAANGPEDGLTVETPVQAKETANVRRNVSPPKRPSRRKPKAKRKPPTQAQLEALAAGRAARKPRQPVSNQLSDGGNAGASDGNAVLGHGVGHKKLRLPVKTLVRR